MLYFYENFQANAQVFRLKCRVKSLYKEERSEVSTTTLRNFLWVILQVYHIVLSLGYMKSFIRNSFLKSFCGVLNFCLV